MHYRFYKVSKDQICLLKFILESYENLMTVSTIDETQSKIQITMAPDFIEDCLTLIDSLQKDFVMVPLSDSPTLSQGNY